MSLTGPDVGLLFDSGHITVAGGDAVEVLRRHVARVCHVHCKDVRPVMIRHAFNRQWSFLDAVLNGVFTVPGDGAIDFAAIVDVLRTHDYQGWLVVEAEQDPTVAPSYTYASKGYRTLRALLDGSPLQEVA
jgi:inosose dehydratase